MHRIIILIFLTFISNEIMAINKCVDTSEKIKYQDRPCPKGVHSKSVDLSSGNSKGDLYAKPFRLLAGNNGSIYIPILSVMEVDIKNDDEKGSSTLKAKSKTGEFVTLLVSTIPLNKSIEGKEQETLSEFLKSVKNQYDGYPGSMLVDSTPINLKAENGVGLLYTYMDSNLKGLAKLPAGESIYSSVGMVIVNNTLITVTILCNDLKSINYAAVLASIHFITH